MTAVNASTLGDENVENSKKLQQAVVGSKTVAADGEVKVTAGPLTNAITAAETKIKEALKTTAATAYDKGNLETELGNIKTKINTILDDKNISKAANEVFTTLKIEGENCEKLNTSANGANASATQNKKIEELEALQSGLENLSKSLQEASDLTNSQMTSLDELRTTLQGFVAKPNDVNLDHTSFTTFLDIY